MNKNLKYIALLLILFISTLSLSGCYNDKNIDHLAYVVALGLDVSDSNNLRLSFQLSTSSEGSSSDGSSSQSDSSVINTIECSSIDSGINLLNSYLSKKVNLAHCKVLVFSEEFAFKGISKEIYTLMNDIEVRPDCNIIISRCSAEYFLSNSKPAIEKLSARYYEIAPSSYEYTGYTDDITLSNFFATLNDSFSECTAILGGVNTDTEKNYNSSLSNNEKDSSYKANQTPISGGTNVENMGIAVFSGDELVGELNGIESMCHLILTNKMETCKISIPDPFDNDDNIYLSLSLKKKTKSDVSLVNGSPYIENNITLSSSIYSMDRDANYLSKEDLKMIEYYANSYLEAKINDYLYKTSKELKSDIDGFGKYLAKNFLFWDDWTEYNWLENYQNSFFKTTVNIEVQSGHLLMAT